MPLGSRTSPVLCTVCESILENNSYEWWERWPKDHPEDRFGFLRKHHPSEKSFCEAVDAGCWICTRLESERRRTGAQESEFDEYNNYRLGSNINLIEPGLYLAFAHPGDRDTQRVILIDEVESWTPIHEAVYKLKSKPLIGGQHMAKITSLWLDRCETTHRCRPTAQQQWYPTRLLDVSGDTDVRLVESENAAGTKLEGPYATLSHCWGKHPFLVLTKESLPEFLDGISPDRLPLTFRELIQFVRMLKIRYVWVDCYCVIQGTDETAKEDWDREASLMCKVYTHSFINIGSAHSTSPHEGLFYNRHLFNSCTLLMKDWRPTRTWRCTNFQLRCDSSFVATPRSHSLHDLAQTPLHKRAWVFQETLLSPRMLSVTGKQVSWQCGEMAVCEDNPLQTVRSITRGQRPFWLFNDVQKKIKASCGVSDEEPYKNDISRRAHDATHEATLESMWFQTLGKYCEKELTCFRKDRIRAIEGIGDRLAQLTGWHYHCGLFSETLPHALLWDAADESCLEGDVEERAAPSWHWASRKRLTESSFYTITTLYDNQQGLEGYAPIAYVFMSDDCLLFPQAADATSLWPCLMCIGRLIDVVMNEDGRFKIHNTDEIMWFNPDDHYSVEEWRLEQYRPHTHTRYVFLPLVYEYGSVHAIGASSGSDSGLRIKSYGLLLSLMPNGRFRRVGNCSPQYILEELWIKVAKKSPEMIIIE
ncbi:hypothetical protein FSARC_10953 [Fusarium sarcochroum]|uniref:Heterokaryon incompatibility domain-containing protein n=1 Tax=Fusarium sarcochroum TaxID=1208366 RepID=A0A8H4X1J0_9HYPO|nr:hypothetical protein FSARC_10953 [Fusarium sarcochroum]